MITTIKINLNDWPNVFFTSDWHLGHNKDFLYGARGRSSRDDYVKWVLEKINEQAGPEDLIIHFGDMCLTSTMDEYISWLNAIRCRNIWSINGNHDNRFFELIRQYDGRYTEEMNNGMVKIKDEKNLKDLGSYAEATIISPSKVPNQKAKRIRVVMCHYTFQIWNHMQHGAWHLCGHSHGNFQETSPTWLSGKRLDCGVENALSWSDGSRVMFSFDDVNQIMSQKNVQVLDHHNRRTT